MDGWMDGWLISGSSHLPWLWMALDGYRDAPITWLEREHAVDMAGQREYGYGLLWELDRGLSGVDTSSATSTTASTTTFTSISNSISTSTSPSYHLHMMEHVGGSDAYLR